MNTRLHIASDHAGLALKTAIGRRLAQQGYDIVDHGTHSDASCDYPAFAHALSRAVEEENGRGILICGTGIGMSIAANKIRGVRAALCADAFSTKYTRLHNDANVMCMGARTLGSGLALELVEIFLDTPFEGGRHEKRVHMITELEQEW